MDDKLYILGTSLVAIGVGFVAWKWLRPPSGNTTGSSEKGGNGDNGGDGDEWEDLAPRGYTLAQLRSFTGEDGGHILVAISGKVYDVTKRGKSFYGPGGGYHVFAGRDASRGLAKMSLESADVDDPRVDDLMLSEIDTLSDWTQKFEMKYKVVGHIVDEPEKRNYSLAELREYDGAHGKRVFYLLYEERCTMSQRVVFLRARWWVQYAWRTRCEQGARKDEFGCGRRHQPSH